MYDILQFEIILAFLFGFWFILTQFCRFYNLIETMAAIRNDDAIPASYTFA